MIEINNQTKLKIDLKKTAVLADAFLRAYKKGGRSVSLALVGPIRMRRLNNDYRGIDQATDVLSFPAETPAKNKARSAAPANKHLGEIIINLAEIKKPGKYRMMLEEIGLEAGAYGRPPKAGRGDNYLFYFFLIHGLLHLAGYDDATEKGRREMMERGKEFLARNK
jgi:probable rRNA maturation factor